MKSVISRAAIAFLIAISFFSLSGHAHPFDFDKAKKFLMKTPEMFDSKTIYCGCSVYGKKVDLSSCGYRIQSDPKRANRLEIEHVVPAEAFGNSFEEWRTGTSKCSKNGKRFKGRKCAKTNHEFSQIEGDPYNLFFEIGELNGLRSNYSMAEISGKTGQFGRCQVKLQDRKFEPSEEAKGIVARTYLHMDHRYPGRGIVSNKNRKLFEAWNKLHPITPLECKRWRIIERSVGYAHLFSSQCK